MDPAAGASGTIKSLKWKLIEVFEVNADGLLDELSLYLISLEEYINLKAAESPVERIENMLNLILEKGEPACEKFLKHLENMIPRFPKLQNLSGHFPENKAKIFEDLLVQLGMTNYISEKLKLKNILNIGKKNVMMDINPQCEQDILWYFLKNLIALNRNARNIHCETDPSNMESSVDSDENDDPFGSINFGNNEADSINPLDVLCVLLHCSDIFLQQEILSKMSMCQFAVPLLIPAGDGSNCTLMLWAMRDIVKKWRPQSLADSKGFKEENLVAIEMPTFSFVRLGKTKLSKSKILNQVLSPAQQHNDFFIHDNMEGGNIQRKLSDGLVEMSWYFPSGSKGSDISSDPIAVTNLRGDLESNWTQFNFLSRISSAVFIFIESIGEREFRLLSNCDNKDTEYYFIITPSPGKEVSKETIQNLKKLKSLMKTEKNNIILKKSSDNDSAVVKQIRTSILSAMKNSSNKIMIKTMWTQASELCICVDEDSMECRNARKQAENITREITDVAQYKKETMCLQGDLWKKISKLEKEMCRLREQGAKDTQEYLDDLNHQHSILHKKQHAHDLPTGIMLFINAIVNLPYSEKHYFLKWLKFDLDVIARNNLADLQAEYKEKCNNSSKNLDELKQLDQKISDSSLGIEHFLREMGQFYEAECYMSKEKLIQKDMRQFTKLPGIAADLLLDGFPLELIDGDASNIPLQWITDVLTELDTKTGGQCRMRVITVLGVQSTGKSTLLNTMFGLQFPVASGRCTRGAYMTFIKVEGDFLEELGCDFILVIDTEGLKAPELASLEGSYEHDNELATLVIGLSDITIINMAMENTAEMKDILQIVVHAFLRMKAIGKKLKCLFVHQNVSDVSAHENNMRDRKKLLEQLDEMTGIAAKMENKIGITKFSDVMDYDISKDSWYVPGLWHGVPPMAPVNTGYSETVSELKKYSLGFLKTCRSLNTSLNIKYFILWVSSLWNALKHEKFIFSFRNSLVAEAYNKLSIQFSQWEWDFTKAVHSWVINTETQIRNQSADTLNTETYKGYKNNLQTLLCKEENKMSASLEKYFEHGTENVQLIENHREDFFQSVMFLKKELERHALNKCTEALNIQKGKHEIQSIQNQYQKLIEEKVINLLKTCRGRKLSDRELEEEFETMWTKTISDLETVPLRECDINQSIIWQLRNNMSKKGPEINEKLLNANCLDQYRNQTFKMDKAYIDRSFSDKVKSIFIKQDYYDKISQFAVSLMDRCDQYVTEKVSKGSDYDDTYCQELLRMIDESLSSKNQDQLHTNLAFELDIKLQIFGRATPRFQEMHKRFIQENDPKLCLEKLKPQYLSTFLNIFQKKDQCQERAKQFCDLCLKPALIEYIYKHLGKEIVDDVLKSSDNIIFNSRSFFQAAVLKDLLEKEDFQNFKNYIGSYQIFLQSWTLERISEKYKELSQLERLQTNILSDIIKKVQDLLKSKKCLKSPNVEHLLGNLCEELKSDLVISQNQMNIVTFGNNADVKQFSGDIQSFLSETEQQILLGIKGLDVKSILSKVTLKPENELLKKVMGCGKQCPFCRVPCEAGGSDHKEHFASIHRPQGLGRYGFHDSKVLCTDICSTDVVSNTASFRNSDTELKTHLYKEYRTLYPDWSIQPDPSIESSDYWKYIFMKFNEEFAKEYNAEPAKLPDGWKQIDREQALRSLKEVFNMK
ncbi:up-regulator of cell proliferation-like [Pelobates fuscus]|uniref:up-regulator of cell proliferation-like n=1 Tax=Pelobates fuscus TaxID=191477 RepID=UPI002FE4D463